MSGEGHDPQREELPMIGEIGASFLLQTLTSAGNPLQAIEQFRIANGIHSPLTSVNYFLPAIELTDLQDKPRREIYQQLLNHFLGILLKRTQTLTEEQRQILLKETFPYLGFKELRELPFTLLQQIKTIPQPFLIQLGANQELYDASPLSVQRQIWAIDTSLFLKQIQPLFDGYIKNAILSPTPLDDTTLPKKRFLNFPNNVPSIYHLIILILLCI